RLAETVLLPEHDRPRRSEQEHETDAAGSADAGVGPVEAARFDDPDGWYGRGSLPDRERAVDGALDRIRPRLRLRGADQAQEREVARRGDVTPVRPARVARNRSLPDRERAVDGAFDRIRARLRLRGADQAQEREVARRGEVTRSRPARAGGCRRRHR